MPLKDSAMVEFEFWKTVKFPFSLFFPMTPIIGILVSFSISSVVFTELSIRVLIKTTKNGIPKASNNAKI